MVELSPSYTNGGCTTAQEDRLIAEDLICVSGVAHLSDGALLVTAGVAGLTVSVAAGGAFIRGTEVSGDQPQGTYHVFNNAPVTVGLSSADPTNPRIDTIVGRVYDQAYSGGVDAFSIETLDGTPTVGANLTNLLGAFTPLPDSTIILGYVLVPANATLPGQLTVADVRESYETCAENVPPGVGLLGREVFTSDGTFEIGDYPRAQYVKVTVVGGGAGSGGCAATGGATVASAGGGGGGGGAEGLIAVADLLASEPVDVGAGGAGATAGNNDGTNGSPSTFGTHLTGAGGTGGGGSAATSNTSNGISGAGGNGGGGTIGGTVIAGTGRVSEGSQGGAGHCLSGSVTVIRSGGSSGFGTGGTVMGGNSNNSAAVAGRLYGGGAAGGCSSINQSARAGAAGAAGIVIVEVF